MKNLVLIACVVMAAAAGGTEKADPGATVHRFIDAFNKGDIETAEATHAPDVAIVDEVAPYQWQGHGAFKAWLDDLTKHDTANGVTDGNVKLGNTIRQEVTGDHAYVVVASEYTFKQKGVAMKEPSQMTFALRNGRDGWRIVAWTFAGPKPTP